MASLSFNSAARLWSSGSGGTLLCGLSSELLIRGARLQKPPQEIACRFHTYSRRRRSSCDTYRKGQLCELHRHFFGHPWDLRVRNILRAKYGITQQLVNQHPSADFGELGADSGLHDLQVGDWMHTLPYVQLIVALLHDHIVNSIGLKQPLEVLQIVVCQVLGFVFCIAAESLFCLIKKLCLCISM